MSFGNAVDVFILIGVFYISLNIPSFLNKVGVYFNMPPIKGKDEVVRDPVFILINIYNSFIFIVAAMVLVVHESIHVLFFMFLVINQIVAVAFMHLTRKILYKRYKNLRIKIFLILFTIIAAIVLTSIAFWIDDDFQNFDDLLHIFDFWPLTMKKVYFITLVMMVVLFLINIVLYNSRNSMKNMKGSSNDIDGIIDLGVNGPKEE